MYFLLGAERAFRNLLTLAIPHSREEIEGPRQLAKAFKAFLEHHGFCVAEPDPNFSDLPLVKTKELGARLASLCLGAEAAALLKEAELPTAAFLQIQMGYQHFERRAPELAELFKALIGAVLVVDRDPTPEPGHAETVGGSTPKALGSLWLSASNLAGRTIADVSEFLLHELTHNLVNIEECLEPLFDPDALGDPDCRARSAILKQDRSIDRAFHSVVVATELLLARGQGFFEDVGLATVHPSSDVLLRGTSLALRSLLELQSRRRVLTQNGLEILWICRSQLADLDPEQSITQELSFCAE